MSAARVLVIDDSLTMRALFGDVLERCRDIVVVGSAASAEEAREMIPQLRPDVLTLDVEMPGMNGLDFLAEIMATKPLPVVMLSTLTQKGATTSLKAFELGAVDCFPKPMKATPDEFEKIAEKLGKLVVAASKSNLNAKKKAPPKPVETIPEFHWNGKLVGLSASTGGVDAMETVLREFPENCPPTLVVMPIDPELVQALVNKLSGNIRPKVVMATDGMPAEQGHVYFAADPTRHVVIDKWPSGNIRMMDRDPVKGARPSASLLFASMAKAGGAPVGVIMSGMGEDGGAGLKVLRDTGGLALAQDQESSLVYEAAAAAVASGAVERQVGLSDLATAILGACSTGN